ncbi:MAG: hypothetical protein N2Z80_07490 [Hydrogenothermaceae bacterium]|nr:hypothetical protein [Hydrogenothermaceae bacterium]
MEILRSFNLSWKNVSLILFLMSMLLAFSVGSYLNSFKQRYYSLYLQLKEMNFLINNVYTKTLSKDEQSVRSFIESFEYKVEYISQKEGSIEIHLSFVDPVSMARLSHILESNGFEIAFFKATDNTGNGNFFIEVVVR